MSDYKLIYEMIQQLEDDCRPNSLSSCLNKKGQIDTKKYQAFMEKEDELQELQDQLRLLVEQ